MPDPQLTPGQALAGQQQAPPPTQAGPTQAPPQQQAPQGQPQQPQPTPRQVTAARHHDIGKAASFLFGQERDLDGQPIKQAPGAMFRNLLAGALLGGALGSEGTATGGSFGGFLSGFTRGGNAVQQQQYARQQQAQQRARQKEEMSLEERKFDEEKTQHSATLEHWNLENLAHARDADYRDREELEKEQAQEENVQKYAIENGGTLASIPHNNESGNGPTLMKAMVNNPQSFAAPDGYGRLIAKAIDFSGLDHNAKNGWTENGKEVDWSQHMKWSVYYVPKNADGKRPVTMSGADWQKYYGVKGLEAGKNYNVESVQHLVAAATAQRKNERDDFNSSFKERHDALNATINSARTNITQLNNEKRELIRQGFAVDDDEVKDLDDKIEDEQQREQDAIGQMHPRIRHRVAKPNTTAQPAQPGTARKSRPNATGDAPAGATMKVPGSDGKLHWSDGKQDLGIAQ
jgi:hypothetical protein